VALKDRECEMSEESVCMPVYKGFELTAVHVNNNNRIGYAWQRDTENYHIKYPVRRVPPYICSIVKLLEVDRLEKKILV
jgi:hypothetical protein